jgi:hypothetical protein
MSATDRQQQPVNPALMVSEEPPSFGGVSKGAREKIDSLSERG